MNLIAPILSFIGGLLKTLVAPFIAYSTGKQVEKRKQAEEVLDEVAKVNNAKSNTKLRDRLHDKYK